MERNCGIKSKKNPGGYTKNELISKALETNFEINSINSKSKQELCKLLNIKNENDTVETHTKNCKRKSKNNPNAYTRRELESIYIENGNDKNKLKSFKTIKQLCDFLGVENDNFIQVNKNISQDNKNVTSPNRNCNRKTRNNPNAYSREELENIYINRGNDKKNLKDFKSNKSLCEFLELKDKNEETEQDLSERNCMTKSKKNPKGINRDELIKIYKKNNKANYDGVLNKKELCNILNVGIKYAERPDDSKSKGKLILEKLPKKLDPVLGEYKCKTNDFIYEKYDIKNLSKKYGYENYPLYQTCFKLKNRIISFDLSEILCSKLLNADLEEGINYCNDKSSFLSLSLLKTCANRIFTSPYQCISELITNSIDSYKNERKTGEETGKFGMGFISLLYWIYNYPNKKIIIYSVTKIDTNYERWICEIFINEEGKPKLLLKVLENREDHKGTSIFIVDKSYNTFLIFINRTRYDIEFVRKMKYNKYSLDSKFLYYIKLFSETKVCPIILHAYENEKVKRISINRKMQNFDKHIILKDSVDIYYNGESLMVKDSAQGMSLKVLFESLIIPSSSTKNIKETNIPKKIDVIIKFQKENYFMMCLDDIGILNIKCKLIKSYILNFSSSFTVPVSRDDIIINTQEEIDLFKKSLEEMLEYSLFNDKNDSLLNALKKYAYFTTQQNVKSIILEAVKNFYNNEKLVILPFRHVLYQVLSKDYYNMISKDEYSILKLTKVLKKYYKGDESIIYGKYIVKTDLIETFSNLGTLDIIFVGNEFIRENENWIQLIINNFTLETLDGANQDIMLMIIDILKINLSEIELPKIENFIAKNNIRNKVEKFNRVIQSILNVCEKKSLYFTFEFKLEEYYDLAEFVMTNIIQILLFKDEALINEFLSNYYNVLSDINPCEEVQEQELVCKIIDTELNFSNEKNINKKFKLIDALDNNFSSGHYEKEIITNFIDFNTKSIKKYKLLNLRFMNYSIIYFICSIKFGDITIDDFFEYLVSNFSYFEGIYILYFVQNNIKKFYKKDFMLLDLFKKHMNENYTEEELGKGVGTYYNSKIFQGMVKIMGIYYSLSVTKYIPNLDFGNLISKFKLSDMINHISRYEVDSNKIDWLLQVEPNSFKNDLQFIDIVINTGTTKDIIPSILTELLQNSRDAILLSELKSRIKFEFTSDYIVCKDFVGIKPKNIISLLVPFISSKPLLKNKKYIPVGNMGTGFFNVYRQPISEKVIINTKFPNYDSGLTVVATPILKNSRVVDIMYNFYENNNLELGTEIIIKTKKDCSIESHFYYSNVLATVETPVIINEKIIINKIKKLGEINMNGKIICTCKFIQSRIPSVIQSGGIPLVSLKDFINTSKFKMNVDYPYENLIIDFEPGIITPNQGRDKIIFYNDEYEILVHRCISECSIIFNSYILSSGIYYVDIKDIFSRLSTKKIIQVLPANIGVWSVGFNNNIDLNNIIIKENLILVDENSIIRILVNIFDELFRFSKDNYIPSGKVKSEVINYLKNKPYNKHIKNVIISWYSRKYSGEKGFEDNKVLIKEKVGVDGKIVSKIFEKENEYNPKWDIITPYLQIFVNVFWEIGRKLENDKIITGTHFYNKDAPTIKIELAISPNIKGKYSSARNFIHINGLFLRNNLDYVIKTFENFTLSDLENPQKYMMKNLPEFFLDTPNLVTLIHELTHAWNSDDGHEYHNNMPNLKIKNVNLPKEVTFYNGGYYVYNQICIQNLFEIYRQALL